MFVTLDKFVVTDEAVNGNKECAEKVENKILHGTLIPGATIGEHLHDTNSEVIYILRGHGSVLYDGEKHPISEGQCHYCPKGHRHSLINDSDADLVFFAVIPNQ